MDALFGIVTMEKMTVNSAHIAMRMVMCFMCVR